MQKQLIEAGLIVNTHGIHGEVKINPWCDMPEFLLDFDTYYIDNKPIRVISSRVHKSCVLSQLAGVNDVNAAMLLRNKVIFVDKNEVALEDGQYFIADLIGLEVIDSETNTTIGKISDVLTLPANDVYVVSDSKSEYMIPVVSEYVLDVDMVKKCVTVKLIPGMKGL